MGKQLNTRQRRFVEEYLVDGNGRQAAIRAGYSPARAKVTAYQLLLEPHVSGAVRAGQEARAARLEVTADRLVEDAYQLHLDARADGKHGDATKALELAAKLIGALTERVRTEQTVEVTHHDGEADRLRERLDNVVRLDSRRLAALPERVDGPAEAAVEGGDR